jgi:uncharacterized protein YndB with AHSA1/START domain
MPQHRSRRVLLLALFALVPARAFPEVADSSAAGFTVKITTVIEAAPAEVYRRFLEIGDWWNPQHTWSGDARNLSIEPKAGGCFCEKLPNGGGVRHMEVVHVAPAKTLVLAGGIGPLQSIAATANMSIQLAPQGAATSLVLVYAVAGYLPAGMNTWAQPVDSVLAEQMTRLKSYVEKSRPPSK